MSLSSSFSTLSLASSSLLLAAELSVALLLAVTNTCFRLLDPEDPEDATAGVTTTVVEDFEVLLLDA